MHIALCPDHPEVYLIIAHLIILTSSRCPIESTWWSESMSMAALEAQVELDDEEEDVARSGQLFASRYAALKSTVVIPLVALWSHSAETRGEMMPKRAN